MRDAPNTDGAPSARGLRRRAEEARAVAYRMKHGPARRQMWGLAVWYDVLARHAEEREDREAAATLKSKGRAA